VDKDSIEKVIDGVKLLALCGLAVLAYSLGAQDLAVFIAGGAFGHVVPGAANGARRITPVVTAAAFFIGASALTGCGASAETRGRYALEVSRCVAEERAVIEREGFSYEEDAEAMQLVRERCDAELDRIEQEGE